MVAVRLLYLNCCIWDSSDTDLGDLLKIPPRCLLGLPVLRPHKVLAIGLLVGSALQVADRRLHGDKFAAILWI